MGRVRFGCASTDGRAVRVLCVLVVGGFSLVLAPAADANASFIWAGGSTTTADWSVLENWEGDVAAPTAAEGVGRLTFPELTNQACTSEPGTHACYLSFNNVSGLSAEAVQLDDANDYLLAGDGIALGSGGLTAAPGGGASGSAGAFVEMPLALSTSQRWSVADRSGGAIEENGLSLEGEVTGSASALSVELSNGPALVLYSDTEVGPVTIEGPNVAGEHIDNGVVLLEEGKLNSADRHSVDLSNVFFAGSGAVGALAMNNSTLDVGSGAERAEGIEASSVRLDSTSGVIFEITGSGTTAQSDYSQLVSTGPVELAGAIVVTVGKPSKDASCPVLVPGSTYTFLSTTGPLTGSFANALEGNPEITVNYAKSCDEPSQTMRIGYDRSGGTETVTGTVEAEALSRQREREATQKIATRIAEEVAAERKRQEEASATAARQKQEEERRQEEAAIKKKQEEEAKIPATGSVSLASTSVAVQSNGSALVKLNCLGIASCHGKLTLSAKIAAKDKGKKQPARTVKIGTVSFSISGDETKTVKIKLDAAGGALLSADHGRCGASLAILELAPSPENTQTKTVQLLQRKAAKAKK
jgi:hypothetical protein